MAAGLGADGGEGFHLRAVLLHVFKAGAAEELQGVGHVAAFGEDRVGHFMALAVGDRAVEPMGLQRAGLHLLEAEGQGAIHRAALHRLASQIERTGAAAAVVVDVDHRNAGEPHFIERRLAAGGVAVDVPGIGLLNLAVVQAGILQRQADGLRAHFDIGTALAGLGKRNHADTGDIDFLRHHFLQGQLTSSGLCACVRRRMQQPLGRWLRSDEQPRPPSWRGREGIGPRGDGEGDDQSGKSPPTGGGRVGDAGDSVCLRSRKKTTRESTEEPTRDTGKTCNLVESADARHWSLPWPGGIPTPAARGRHRHGHLRQCRGRQLPVGRDRRHVRLLHLRRRQLGGARSGPGVHQLRQHPGAAR
ncbi:hypothetical protein D9M70_468300 [compost metagenome]